ncbi:MAG: hypothetical protein COU64_06160 [Candidatus Pacebacteria bacterium CG10_big_fil_rev_8_21_14_0_10_40_26]|uniref:Uncharacterized protein n=1 Tax=Candidatus Roizmanbacteria bacterium CG_4_10_14_0_2_um_filter_39_13 TaxID=1974825 RepID=A0A2M7U1Z2_9BACT|nr:MAG: hypothetical protein COU64_06160 [Candidatus Pacebacteria bacterium CG10_big_fil_rev_8_21_14_0_10_40_26]PIZ64137.1 MAG: hypothetical protein COY16_00030 [Candidatus Roizmanbacteria bacterium CG_4_10_14_0_2_um_filter_39_13]
MENKQKYPFISLVLMFLFIFSFFILFLISEGFISDTPYPLIGKIAIVLLLIVIVGFIIEILRWNRNKKTK